MPVGRGPGCRGCVVIVITVSPDAAAAYLNSRTYGIAGTVADAVPGLGSQQTVEVLAVPDIQKALSDRGLQASVVQVPDADQVNPARSLSAAVGAAVGLALGAAIFSK